MSFEFGEKHWEPNILITPHSKRLPDLGLSYRELICQLASVNQRADLFA